MTSEQSTADRPTDTDLFTTDDAVALYRQRIQDPELFSQEVTAVDRYFTDPGARVLDVGGGVGRVASQLHERGFEVTGIDISEPLVEEARSQFPDIEFRVEDIQNTSFEAGSFQYAVFSFFGLDYLIPKSDRVAALRELYRLLKPSGVLLFSTHNSLHPLVPLSVRDFGRGLKDIVDFYFKPKNRDRLFTPYKIEQVPLGNVEIYLTNPLQQWRQLKRCGFTPLDVVGERDGFGRFFERDPHFVAKK